MTRHSDQSPREQRWLLARPFARGQIAETNQQLRAADVLAACSNRVSADASELEVLELSFIVYTGQPRCKAIKGSLPTILGARLPLPSPPMQMDVTSPVEPQAKLSLPTSRAYVLHRKTLVLRS